MKVLVTGATGFIGMHILNAIIKSEHDILSMGLKEKSLGKKNEMKPVRP